MPDPFESAFYDYLNGKEDAKVIVHCNKGETEEIAISYFFRDFNKMPEVEKKALSFCRGKILDIGAGSGVHSLYLQNEGFNITALDIKPGFVDVMKRRGIKNTVISDIFNFKEGKFDTLLMLMNGIGFTKNLAGLKNFLLQAKTLLNDGGQLILDSSDLMYLYEDEDGGYSINLNEEYYGEVEYEIEYNNVIGEMFHWLYIDFGNLLEIAEECGFNCEKIIEDNHFNYLARLTISH